MDGYIEYLDFDDDSDQEGAESSDDEIDILLHGTPEQKRKLCHRRENTDKDSSEDEFEKEMNAELNGQVKEIERRRGSVSGEASSSTSANTEGAGPQRYIDDVYCDSDEEDMVTKGDAKKNQKELSNDDLLYDPDIDDDNEKWVEKRRRSYLSKGQGSSNKKQKKLPNSDAVLDCPACMTTLCLDCQRHDVYENQYRAMFVMNCKVDTSETLKYPKQNKNSKKRKKSESKTMESTDTDDKFNPVKCEECNTIVGVYDQDEIYHFFNVLSSY